MSSTNDYSRKRKEPKRRSERIKKLKPKSESQFPHIPEEILLIILPKLPINSLLRFRCVSKSWCSSISNPKFNISSPKQQVICVTECHSMKCSIQLINDEALSKDVPIPIPLEENGKFGWGLTIRGSCNGLVLLSNTLDLFLWNPSTRCCKKVLSHERLNVWDLLESVSGLCYDDFTDDYKVVMFGYRPANSVMVGSCRNKTWTEVCSPYNEGPVKLGPVVNGRLHWLVSGSNNWLVVGFDPRTNEFVNVPMPQSKKENPVFGLGVLHECLSLALSADCKRLNETEVEVFVMKSYGDQASWTRLFVVKRYGGQASGTSSFVISNVKDLFDWHRCLPLCFTQNAEVLMQLEKPLPRKMNVYNLELNFCRGIPIPTETFIYDTKTATFVESLVSPPYYKWEEEEEYTEILLSGSMNKWKYERGDDTWYKMGKGLEID